MVRRLFGSFSAVVLLAFAAGASAGETAVHSYTLPGSGELRLTTPAGWQDEIKPGEGGMPPSIAFRPARGNAFRVMVTPVAPPADAVMEMPSLAKLRASVERGREKAAPQAVEKHIAVRELRSHNAAGYYFTATDKAPGSGHDDFRAMTHFEVVAGRVLLMVTAFYNDDSGKVREQVAAMLARAQFEPGDQGSAQKQDHGSDQSLKVSKMAAGYQVTLPASALILTLPEPDLVQAEGPGASASPGYFSFRDRAQGLILSGWFEPADGFPGMQPFWTGETAAWKKNGLPDPVDVAFSKVGDWDAVAYDLTLPVPNATDTHLRAERVQDGTWIDLHLSLTSSLSSAEARARLQAILKAITVQKK